MGTYSGPNDLSSLSHRTEWHMDCFKKVIKKDVQYLKLKVFLNIEI